MVNVLSSGQADVSTRFSRPYRDGRDPAAGVTFARSALGIPVIEGALVQLECHRYALHPAGDHLLILGKVVGIRSTANARPLVYHDRSYTCVAASAHRTVTRRHALP